MKECIYIASPYSSKIKDVRESRFQDVALFTGFLAKHSDYVIYSPIVHWHVVSKILELPGDYNFWERQCIGMLERCQRFFVLQLYGWADSVGVDYETRAASKLGLEVEYVSEKAVLMIKSMQEAPDHAKQWFVKEISLISKLRKHD